MKGVPVTEEVEQEIIAMHRVGGFTMRDIAQEVGTSEMTVSRVLSALEIDALRDNNGEILPAIITYTGGVESTSFVAVINAYNQGMPVAELCEAFRISVQQMYQVLRDSGVPTRAQQQAESRNRRVEDAIRMYASGSPLWEIEVATQVSGYSLNRELHRRGVPLRRPRKIIT